MRELRRQTRELKPWSTGCGCVRCVGYVMIHDVHNVHCSVHMHEGSEGTSMDVRSQTGNHSCQL